MGSRLDLIERNIEALRRSAEVLKRIDDGLYTASNPALPGGSIGKHLRHQLDAYASFLEGRPRRRVDYDARERDPAVETRRAEGMAHLRRTIRALHDLAGEAAARSLRVRMEGSASAAAGTWARSSEERELSYLLSHTIHHDALIAVFLRSASHDPGAGFGVAPGTLRHWKRLRRAV